MARFARAMAYGTILQQIDYGRYVMADILQQVYYNRNIMEDT